MKFCRLSHDVPVKRLFGVQSGYWMQKRRVWKTVGIHFKALITSDLLKNKPKVDIFLIKSGPEKKFRIYNIIFWLIPDFGANFVSGWMFSNQNCAILYVKI